MTVLSFWNVIRLLYLKNALTLHYDAHKKQAKILAQGSHRHMCFARQGRTRQKAYLMRVQRAACDTPLS